MKICIVGLPRSCKSSLFSALMGASPESAVAKGADPVAVVKVPDPRLERLARIFEPRKKTAAAIEFVELQGISAGEPKHAPFSEQFLGKLRTADALLAVVRSFRDPSVPHPLDPGMYKSLQQFRILASQKRGKKRIKTFNLEWQWYGNVIKYNLPPRVNNLVLYLLERTLICNTSYCKELPYVNINEIAVKYIKISRKTDYESLGISEELAIKAFKLLGEYVGMSVHDPRFPYAMKDIKRWDNLFKTIKTI